MTRRGRLALAAVLGALVLLFGGRWAALRYTEHAWYADLGLGGLYWRLLARGMAWKIGVFATATGWYTTHCLAVVGSIGAVHLPRRVGNLEIAEAVPRLWLRGLALGIAFTLGLATTYTFADLDHFAALYRHAVPLGVLDPVLGKDAAFYLARLPLLELLQLACLLSTVLALLLVAGLYLLTGSLTASQRRLRITPHARTHLVVLLAVLALVLAWGFQLRTYELVGGGGDQAGVLSPVDRAIRLPASNALALIALVVAVGTVFSVRMARMPVLFGLWVTLIVASLLGRLVVPLLADAWSAARAPVDGTAADWPRRGVGVLGAPFVTLDADPEPRADVLAQAGPALARVSPWSTEPGLLDAALAHATLDTGIARTWTTTITTAPGAGGQPRLVALGVGQTNPLLVSRAVPRPPWSETHRRAAAWGGELYAVDASARAGPLRFFGSLAPSDTGARALRPLARVGGRIRFLPDLADLGIVGPDEGAVGAPPPGLPLHGFVRRLLFAWALQAPPLLGRNTSTADRVLFWRDVPTRLARLYPFATFGKARAALAGGRLVWLADGYLASPRYPLATHIRWRDDDVNYLTAPFVAAVDAEHGATRLYLRPDATPFAASVARGEGIEPLPHDSLPRELRAQLGYPAALLGAQATVLARFGQDSAGARVEWALANRDTVARGDVSHLEPAYALLDLGDGVRPWLLLPLSDRAGNRLTALVAGGQDDNGAARLRLLRLDGEFPTPQAVGLRLSSATAALAINAAAAQTDGTVRHGAVVPVPVDGTVAYVAAVFATERRTARPMTLRAIGVASGTRAGFGLDARGAALAAARGEASPGSLTGAEALQAARAAFLALDSAVRNADWTQFGRAYTQLRRALNLDTSVQP